MATEVRYSWDGPKLTTSSSAASKQSNSNGKDKFICTKQIFESLQSSNNKLIQAKSPKLSSKNHQDSSTTTAASLESSSEPKLSEVSAITAVQPMTPIDKKRLDVSAIILAFEERSKSTSSLPASMLSMGVSYRRKTSHDNNTHPHSHDRPTSLIYPSNKRSNYFKNYVSAVTTPPEKKERTLSSSIHNNGSGDHHRNDVFSTSSSSEDYHHVEKYYNNNANHHHDHNGHGDVVITQARSESDLKNNNSTTNIPATVDDNCNPVRRSEEEVEDRVNSNNKSSAAEPYQSLRSKLEAYESLSESSSSISNLSHGRSSPVKKTSSSSIKLHHYRESKVQKLSQSFEELATSSAGNKHQLSGEDEKLLRSSSSVPNNLWEDSREDDEVVEDDGQDDGGYDLISTTVVVDEGNDDQANYDLMPNDGDESSNYDEDEEDEEQMNTTYEINPPTPPQEEEDVEEDKSNETFPVLNETFEVDETASAVDKPEESKDLFYYEIPGLPHMEMESDNEYDDTSIPKHDAHKKRVYFSEGPIQVFITYSKDEYDRLNDEADPIAATAEYELEKRLEKLIIFDVEIEKGAQPLGLSIVGIGVGADTGVEKLGMFVKTVVPGGSIHTDNRIQVNDQIIEVDGHSLVGVSQAYASNVLSNTKGTIHFKVGRETDAENSEIARLVNLSIQREQHYDDEFSEDDDDQDDYHDDEFNQAIIADDDDVDCGDQQDEQDRREYWNNDENNDERTIKQEFAFEEHSSPPRVQASLPNQHDNEARSLDDNDDDDGEVDEILPEHLDYNDIDNADVDAATIAELQTQLEQKQNELKEATAHSVVLERKYNKAKKLIKEFQTREQEFMRREASYQSHINKLTEEYMKEKEEYERRLQQSTSVTSQSRDNNHVSTTTTTSNSNNSNSHHGKQQQSQSSGGESSPQKKQSSPTKQVQNNSSNNGDTTDSGEPPSGIYENLTEDIIGELDNVLATNRPSTIFNNSTTNGTPTKPDEKDEATSWTTPVRNSIEIPSNNSANNSVVSRDTTATDEIQRMMSQTLTMDKTYQITAPIGKKSSNTTTTSTTTTPYEDIVVQPNPRHIEISKMKRPLSATSTVSSEGGSNVLDTSSQHNNSSSMMEYVENSSNDPLTLPNWSNDDVTEWLKRNEMDQFVMKFQQYNITGQNIANMDVNFKEIGITHKVMRSHLKRKCKELKSLYEKRRKQAEKQARKNKKMKSANSGGRKSPFS